MSFLGGAYRRGSCYLHPFSRLPLPWVNGYDKFRTHPDH